MSLPEEWHPLKAYNNKLDMHQAYSYTAEQILKCLKEMAVTPVLYLDTRRRISYEGLTTKDQIMILYREIESLSVPKTDRKEKMFGDHRLEPTQHIARQLHSDQKKFRFDLRLVPRTRRKQTFLGLYDVLGLFMSIFEAAPHAATYDNYYLPLTLVYARWCSMLGTAKKDWTGDAAWNGIGDCPTVFQCTWCRFAPVSNDSGSPYRFMFGATVAGAVFQGAKGWHDMFRTARHDVVKDILADKYQSDVDKSPLREGRDGEFGTRFGNCAETYPFSCNMIGFPPTKSESFGLAVHKSVVERDNLDAAFAHARTQGILWPPCTNCKHILTNGGRDLAKFEPARYDLPASP